MENRIYISFCLIFVISKWISEEILWHNTRGFVTYEKTMT